MRKLAVTVALLAASAWAADVWQTKKYTDWNEKDIQKVLDNSPWAKPVNVSGDIVESTATRGKRGSGGRSGITEVGNPNEVTQDPMGDAPRSGVGRTAQQNVDPDRGSAPLLTFTVRWESALPVKEARIKAKYGSEAATSTEAKRILEAEEPTYVITVSGLRANVLRGDEAEVKKQALADAELIVKGRDPIKPVDFRLERGRNAAVAMFAFPKSAPLLVDDKEVEFRAKFDSIPVKQKFQLKNMVFGGKLEL